MNQQEFLNLFRQCIETGDIKIVVNITPEYAESGSGQWNVTQASVLIGNEWHQIDVQGEVNMCEPI